MFGLVSLFQVGGQELTKMADGGCALTRLLRWIRYVHHLGQSETIRSRDQVVMLFA